MAREQRQERAVSWSDLPAGRRHRLAVLIGRMARRRLGTAPEAAETAHEPFPESRAENSGHDLALEAVGSCEQRGEQGHQA